MLRNLMHRLWDDDQGQLITIEFLFFVTILIIGLITGWVTLRNAIVAELTVLADVILALNPGFAFSGLSGCCSFTEGSQAIVIPTQVIPPICVPPSFPQVITVIPCM